ncbi:hypothetical protein N7476_009068 [Penicillium atrosanguineum]|uniref:Xylose isomerase-like TIM barrel domain-containing protein n=1 Tax=Penicillium atrosanguineum TaxID=1132637 RepID=A0A9W9PST0_9EURO|nr:hypothetical protein N7526_002182 [Penicillium atrosanguineum]KAJ5308412.1 hypothetical protein N7476_009068 [Penicillium atrosanguineum]
MDESSQFRESVKSVPLSYATCSIGSNQADTLPKKLEAISNAGFIAIELAFPDIIDYGSQLLGHQIETNNYAELVTVATDIRKLCVAKKLHVMMLQPFANFEGWPRGSQERKDAFARAEGWVEIMVALETDILQVGSTDIPLSELSQDPEDFISDLQILCDLLARHNKRLAYENWCWSTHAPTWEDVWNVVDKVDRPNIGLCLDTFQSAGSEWGDPTTSSGRIKDASIEDLNRQFLASMNRLASTVPKEKIYLLQISDARKPKTPMENKRLDGLWPRARWSHDFRPMPYDGGYLPVEEVARAVLRTGFRGWFSMEIFDGDPDGKATREETEGMEEYARRAMRSMERLLQSCEDVEKV